ncbi:hypothetical protein GCM10010149_89420 [Nonomuraea roseoviolacea subsp. roseoviolacea]|uniref:hypothetical protein n=1 Tax=Nonomuraea roseoviolacea TaxID=103837 RepID=UPI0031D8F4C3
MTTPIETVPQPVPQAPQPVVQPQTIPAGEQYFTADQVEKFRQQERDKLYGELQKRDELLNQLKGQVDSFAQEREEYARLEAERKAAEEAAARKAAEDEMSARQLVEQQRAEFEQRFALMEQERAAERAALEKEKEFAALQAYIQRRVREESEAQTIAPELIDLVTGNSSDEVEASILRLKEKTNAIVNSMQAAAAQVAPPVPPRGVSPSGYAPTGPMDMHSEQRTVTPEEIRHMSMAEYAKFRQQVGIGGQSNNGQGLFG